MKTLEAPARYHDYVRRTLAGRVPAILRMAAQGQAAEAARRLEALGRAVADDVPMVLDAAAWPIAGWEELPQRVHGRRPSEASFFDFEYWLYSRVLGAVDHPESRIDPFRATKHHDLARHLDWAEQAVREARTLAAALNLSLDANAHDLSQTSGPAASHQSDRDLLQIDPAGLRRINLIADNFGGELVADLVLAIVASEADLEVIVHVKHLPLFVSDTTADDVLILLDRVGRESDFGRRLHKAVDRGAIRFASSPFWSAPKFLDHLPIEELEEGLPEGKSEGEGVLNVLKGDLNFRRAIGDAVVHVDAPFETLEVLPRAPMLSLRSIKSYCVAGMSEWPAGLSREDFPKDGSIVVAQHIPARRLSRSS